MKEIPSLCACLRKAASSLHCCWRWWWRIKASMWMWEEARANTEWKISTTPPSMLDATIISFATCNDVDSNVKWNFDAQQKPTTKMLIIVTLFSVALCLFDLFSFRCCRHIIFILKVNIKENGPNEFIADCLMLTGRLWVHKYDSYARRPMQIYKYLLNV